MVRTDPDAIELVRLADAAQGQLIQFCEGDGQFGLVLPRVTNHRVLVFTESGVSISVAWEPENWEQYVVRFNNARLQLELQSAFVSARGIGDRNDYNGLVGIAPGIRAGVLAEQKQLNNPNSPMSTVFTEFVGAHVRPFDAINFRFVTRWALYAWFAGDPASTPPTLIHQHDATPPVAARPVVPTRQF